MKLIVGLGNPGLKYRLTRHNVGFLVVRYLAKKNRITIRTKKFDSLLGKGVIAGEEVVLALPLTFMNLSGVSINSIVRHMMINLKDLLIICDDVNLDLGLIRMRPKGSSGGHKGLESTIASLESQVFPRLRIGVGPILNSSKYGSLTNYVLRCFNKKELRIIDTAIPKATEACEIWAEEGIVAAMNKFN